jgi:hypothetical protein
MIFIEGVQMKIIKIANTNKKVLSTRWKDYGYPKNHPKNSTPELYSYWQYLRNNNIQVTLYHGTDTTLLSGIQDSGWFKSPELLSKYDAVKFEGLDTQQRNWGMDKLFFTPSLQYAQKFARRTSSQQGGDPVVLEVTIPLWQFDEIRGVVFGQTVHNETGLGGVIEREIKRSISNEEKTNKILEIISGWSGFNTYSELTTKGVLDLKKVRILSKEEQSDVMTEKAIEYIKNGYIGLDYLVNNFNVGEIIKNNPELLEATTDLAISELQEQSKRFEYDYDVEDYNPLIWIENFELEVPKIILENPAYRSVSDAFYDKFNFLVEKMRDPDLGLDIFIPQRYL